MWEAIIKDGIILVVGIIGGYVAAVLGGLHSNRWANYFNNRKLLKTRKTKQQALVAFNRIKEFHERKRDRYPFYLLLATSSILCAIFASTMILIISNQVHEYPIAPEYMIVLLLAGMSMAFSLILAISIYETARQVDRFDDYKAEFEKRWGSVDDESP